jgi:hypothetical protein
VLPQPTAAILACRSCGGFNLLWLGDGTAASRSPRAEVAEYLENRLPLPVIAEHATGKQRYVWVEMSRPVEVAAAAGYAKKCPGYVRRSFKVLG